LIEPHLSVGWTNLALRISSLKEAEPSRFLLLQPLGGASAASTSNDVEKLASFDVDDGGGEVWTVEGRCP